MEARVPKIQYVGECRRRNVKLTPLPSVMRVVLSFLLFFSFGVALFGQETSAKPLLTPGGLIVIPPSIDYESVTNRADITELLGVLPEPSPELKSDVRFNPNAWAKEIRHVRDVWCLQFSFKPVRLIDVDIPNKEGKFDKKKIWYLVYSVKNLGPAEVNDGKIVKINSSLGSAVLEGDEKNLSVPQDETSLGVPRSGAVTLRQQSGIFTPQPGSGEPIKFVPHFILAAHRLVLDTVPVENPETGTMEWQSETTAVAYDDRVIPLALPAIMRREGMAALPETTVSITQKEIAPGQELWGVAMWTDVDPRINEFSIFVSGLTNAYQWADRVKEDGTYENRGRMGEGRIIKRRVLRTDWWRTGDKNSLDESQIRFGSRTAEMPTSPFDQTGRLSPEERKKLDEHTLHADTNKDGWVSPDEKALYHLINQDWLKPSFGYEWVFL